MPYKDKDPRTIEEIFIEYGFDPPRRWDSRQLPVYKPRFDCFGFIPDRMDPNVGKCSALNRLYCRYEKCDFFKPWRKEKTWKTN